MGRGDVHRIGGLRTANLYECCRIGHV
jgi:hypothetical protein